MCHVQCASCDMQCVTFIVPIASSGGPSKRPCLMGGRAQLSLMGGTVGSGSGRAACTVVMSVQLVWLDALGGSAALTEALLDALHDALRAKLAALWVTPVAAPPCSPQGVCACDHTVKVGCACDQ